MEAQAPASTEKPFSPPEDKRRGGLVVSGISLLVVSAGPWVRNANELTLGPAEDLVLSLAHPDTRTHSGSCMRTDKHTHRGSWATSASLLFLSAQRSMVDPTDGPPLYLSGCAMILSALNVIYSKCLPKSTQ